MYVGMRIVASPCLVRSENCYDSLMLHMPVIVFGSVITIIGTFTSCSYSTIIYVSVYSDTFFYFP